MGSKTRRHNPRAIPLESRRGKAAQDGETRRIGMLASIHAPDNRRIVRLSHKRHFSRPGGCGLESSRFDLGRVTTTLRRENGSLAGALAKLQSAGPSGSRGRFVHRAAKLKAGYVRMPGRKPLFWQSNDWSREAKATERAVRAEARTVPGLTQGASCAYTVSGLA